MDAPLGRAVGNANEVVESIETLKGRGPKESRRCRCCLPRGCWCSPGWRADEAEADARVRQALTRGAGLEKFRAIIEAQGGDPRVVDDYARLPRPPREAIVDARRATASSQRLDAELVGRAAVALGAGRDRVDAAVDPAAGIDVVAPVGTAVRRGDVVLVFRAVVARRLTAARALIDGAVTIGDGAAAGRGARARAHRRPRVVSEDEWNVCNRSLACC